MAEIGRNQLKRGRRSNNKAVLNTSELKVGEIIDPQSVLNDSFAKKHNEHIASNSKNVTEDVNSDMSRAHRVQKTTSVDAIDNDVNDIKNNRIQDVENYNKQRRGVKQSRGNNNNTDSSQHSERAKHENVKCGCKEAENTSCHHANRKKCTCHNDCCCWLSKFKVMICKMWNKVVKFFKASSDTNAQSKSNVQSSSKPRSRRNNAQYKYNSANKARK